jgi:hypothetical protein
MTITYLRRYRNSNTLRRWDLRPRFPSLLSCSRDNSTEPPRTRSALSLWIGADNWLYTRPSSVSQCRSVHNMRKTKQKTISFQFVSGVVDRVLAFFRSSSSRPVRRTNEQAVRTDGNIILYKCCSSSSEQKTLIETRTLRFLQDGYL